MTIKVTGKTVVKRFGEGYSNKHLINQTCIKDTIKCSFQAKIERKSTECHDYSDLKLHDGEVALKVNGKL